ncbi:MAG: GEVED domain-containing protein, partial [Caldilineaceae bacterium]
FTDEVKLDSSYTVGGQLSFCFIEDESTACPDDAAYPNLVVQAPAVEIHYSPSDLGDAPDSTNHAATAMAAYPGVQADFPTVFDAATGLPEGPLHRNPRPFHLGQRVSREGEADQGPDQDPLNNIVPAANDPDNDRGDDGTNFALWNLTNCQTTNLPVQVAITPQAVNYFQNLGTPGYLNIWIDSNRDGDWADAVQCGQQPAPEHIVIDAPVNVVGLGAGIHNINVATGLVPWTTADKPAWVRITLSELPSNKTLSAGGVPYGDGRGYANPFKTGETEDYLYRPATAGGGPDIDVRLTAQSRKVAAQEPGLQAAAVEKLGNFEIQLFKIDYGNIGVQTATGAKLTFSKPPALQNGKLILLQSPGIAPSSFSLNFEKIEVILPELTPNKFGAITLGWYGCLTCTLAAANVNADITANVEVTLAGDVDTSNNQSNATARGLLSSPIIGLVVPRPDNALCNNEVIEGIAVTNRSTSNCRDGGAESADCNCDGATELSTVTADPIGNYNFTATLSEGLHNLSANYINSPRDPASGLPTGRLRLYAAVPAL